ncbi:hypothetical protein KIV66_gp06 [Mycobacterium phage MyraDee]|uniref:Uncharacterized protein n=1 Tax=Mycobacterium phage MyraDee TaxID=2024303 RepID=A0A222YZ68_9CAUD|nr:hypothetical protein KIV66_gp06 [Mycobacterium phage MyraDee]ASR77114.1 hypothetical protein SEA_MYRADEE_6 [Mycobacterium phage MyraDee]
MRAKIIALLLKQIVKYCIKHPNVIPGTLDDRWLPVIAKQLGI